MHSHAISAKLKCPVSAKLKCPNYPSVRWRRRRLGFLTMSGNELQRIEVLAEVLSRRRTEASAATILGISTRQTRRLVVAYRASGGASVIHKGRGRASNNRLLEGIREYAVELVRSNYADFGPSLAAEMLFSKHDLKVSRESATQKKRWGPAGVAWEAK